MKKYLKNSIIMALVMMLAVSFTACGGSNGYASDMSAPVANMKAEGFYASTSSDFISKNSSSRGEYGKTIENDAANSGNIDGPIERKLIKNGSMSLQTKSFDQFVDYVNEEVAKVGGYLEQSSMNNSGYSYRHMSMVARIPQQYFETFIENMSNSSLATVQHKSSNQQDITESYIDALSHVSALEIEQERLLEILKSADNIEYIIRIEDKLADIRQNLAYYDSIIRNYDSLVYYSTISINIDEVLVITVEPDTLGSRIANEFEADIQYIKDNIEDFIVWFLGNIISILIWVAVICGCVIIIIKYIKRRKAKTAEILRKQYEANKAKALEEKACEDGNLNE
ncbi:MAG: DUF4349 domain-containing protein [Lachnospiraceae bacterium]|nr:DUF4349 domain-containing protein [Lachnospiraceae bacterium]